MSNALIASLLWVAAITHVAVGLAAWRRGSASPWLPVVNLAVATGVLLYWLQKWIGILSRGVTWYASDQLVPAYALAVCVISVATLTGRANWNGVHWTLFAVHTVVMLAAALFFTFFRINRLF